MNKRHTEFKVVHHLFNDLLSGLQSILKEHAIIKKEWRKIQAGYFLITSL
ncbi:hypothetical protein [Legionella quinlivanii]|nr:hypothetical protein [Legionella quinlivanii]